MKIKSEIRCLICGQLLITIQEVLAYTCSVHKVDGTYDQYENQIIAAIKRMGYEI